MTRDQAQQLLGCHSQRDRLLKTLKALKDANSGQRVVKVRIDLNGEWHDTRIEKALLSAPWLIELHAIEREIRELGGTL